MANVLQTLRERAKETPNPDVVKVSEPQTVHVTVEEESEEVKNIPSVQAIISTKTIKQNDPGVPVHGFTLEVLADEVGLVLEKAMHKSGVNSVSKETFGLFSQVGIVPRGFNLVEDPYTGKEFYVLRNSNRMTEIFKSLVRALGASNSSKISFPYLTESVLELPMSYNPAREDFEYQKLKVTSLYLTPDEISNLNYKFIKEIQFCETNPEVEGTIDLLVMEIDREEWQAAPYRV